MPSTKPFTLRRGLTWILAGGTFLGVLATAGCAAICPALGARTDGGESKGEIVAQAARHADIDPWQEPPQPRQQPAPSGVVNVFGEFGGARRNAPVRPVGEVGFQQHTSVDEGEDSGVAVDPSGRWMVYASTRHSERA